MAACPSRREGVRVFSKTSSRRRPFEHSPREQLVDEAFARYIDWLAASEAVNAAYGVWSRGARTDGALRFAAYAAALDREERAANVYRSVIDQVPRLLGSGEEGLAAAQRGAARA